LKAGDCNARALTNRGNLPAIRLNVLQDTTMANTADGISSPRFDAPGRRLGRRR